MTSLSQEWTVPMEDVGDQKQENTMGSIEGKD
jgi:hypothetical protein